METFTCYIYATALWFSLQALTLISSPRLIFTLLSSEVREVTGLESYLCRSLGFTLLTLSALTAILQSAPLNSTSIDSTTPEAPYAFPALITTMVYQVFISFYSYSSWLRTKQMSFALSMAIYGLLAMMGGWCVLFGRDGGHLSRKSGADKRTSGFPFKNAEADKKKLGKGH